MAWACSRRPIIKDQYARRPPHVESVVYNRRGRRYNIDMVRNRLASYFYPRWIVIALLSTLVVLALTHIPQEALPRMFRNTLADKIQHFGAYGLVAAFLILSLRRPVRLWLLLAVLSGLALVGALDEVTQPLVHRHASIIDYAADLVGIAVACSIFLIRGRPWLSAPRA